MVLSLPLSLPCQVWKIEALFVINQSIYLPNKRSAFELASFSKFINRITATAAAVPIEVDLFGSHLFRLSPFFVAMDLDEQTDAATLS